MYLGPWTAGRLEWDTRLELRKEKHLGKSADRWKTIQEEGAVLMVELSGRNPWDQGFNEYDEFDELSVVENRYWDFSST